MMQCWSQVRDTIFLECVYFILWGGKFLWTQWNSLWKHCSNRRPFIWKLCLMKDHLSFQTTFSSTFPYRFLWKWPPDQGPPLFSDHLGLILRTGSKRILLEMTPWPRTSPLFRPFRLDFEDSFKEDSTGNDPLTKDHSLFYNCFC